MDSAGRNRRKRRLLVTTVTDDRAIAALANTGDSRIPAISAASILAKTARDAEMLRLHQLYPHYGLDRHKGYPTAAHLAALERYGVGEIHRRSYAPIRRLLEIQIKSR